MPGTIRVTVQELADIKAPAGRKYTIQVFLGGKVEKTPALSSTASPAKPGLSNIKSYNADFIFTSFSLKESVEFTLLDSRGVGVGSASVPVTTIVSKGSRNEFLELSNGGRLHTLTSFSLSDAEKAKIAEMKRSASLKKSFVEGLRKSRSVFIPGDKQATTPRRLIDPPKFNDDMTLSEDTSKAEENGRQPRKLVAAVLAKFSSFNDKEAATRVGPTMEAPEKPAASPAAKSSDSTMAEATSTAGKEGSFLQLAQPTNKQEASGKPQLDGEDDGASEASVQPLQEGGRSASSVDSTESRGSLRSDGRSRTVADTRGEDGDEALSNVDRSLSADTSEGIIPRGADDRVALADVGRSGQNSSGLKEGEGESEDQIPVELLSSKASLIDKVSFQTAGPVVSAETARIMAELQARRQRATEGQKGAQMAQGKENVEGPAIGKSYTKSQAKGVVISESAENGEREVVDDDKHAIVESAKTKKGGGLIPKIVGGTLVVLAVVLLWPRGGVSGKRRRRRGTDSDTGVSPLLSKA